MNEKDVRNENGPGSAGPDKEYRSEDRYSAYFSPGDMPSPGMKNGEGEDAAGWRKNREELENQYRNDPRFNMLFDQDAKVVERLERLRQRQRYIKVAGIRLTPKRILILLGFAIVILVCVGACFFYAFKDIGKYRHYARASALYEAGDYEGARELFIKVISEDPNKEEAVAAMADIYRHFGDWANEAFFRQRLMRLNPLNPDYAADFMNAAFRARNFNSIYSLLNLKLMENPELPPEEGALYLVSALLSAHVPGGKAFYSARKRERRDYFSSTETGRLAELLLTASELDEKKVKACIESLDGIRDPQVRFETINVLLYYFSKQDDPESEAAIEKLLFRAAELNNYAGAPMLADFYFSRGRFDETIRICEEYLKTKMNAQMPIFFGESCVLSGQAERIRPLADKIRNLHGRQSKTLAAYLDALVAFCEEDLPRMRTFLLEAGSTIETPLSLLMKFHLAVLNDSPKEILPVLGSIMRKPFLDFQTRAGAVSMLYLLKKFDNGVPDEDTLQDCAGIAALIQEPDERSSFLQRIILLDHRNRGILKEDEVLSSLERYPDDFIMLRIAAEYYLQNGQPERAMDFISAYNELKDVPDRSFIAVLHLLALAELGREQDAEKEFRTLLEEDGGETLLYPYYSFCIESGLLDSLKSLASWLETLPKDSSVRSALPFVRAEILYADAATKEQALDLFEKSESDDPRFVFHAATRLAKAGRLDAAFKRYLSIRDTAPDKALVDINLSELYFGRGEKDAALASARSAWQESRNSLLSRYTYGKRLFELGQYADVLDVLNFPLYKASFPEEMLNLWEKCIRECIKADFDAGRYGLAQEKARHLVTYFPRDKFGQEILQKIEDLRIQEKNAEKNKEKQRRTAVPQQDASVSD